MQAPHNKIKNVINNKKTFILLSLAGGQPSLAECLELPVCGGIGQARGMYEVSVITHRG